MTPDKIACRQGRGIGRREALPDIDLEESKYAGPVGKDLDQHAS